MKKLLIFIVVIALAGALYTYRDDLMQYFSTTECPAGEVWSEEQQACVEAPDEAPEGDEEPVPSSFDLSAIDTITVRLDDAAEGTVTITRDDMVAQPFSRQFTTAQSPVDGTVVILTEYMAHDAATGTVLMPYAVNYGGSGTFVHAGLFSVGGTTLTLQDSYLIGDRISVERVYISGGAAHVLFRDRREGEPLVATPTVAKEAVIPFTSVGFGEASMQLREDGEAVYKDLLRVSIPGLGSTVSSPITVRGEARGNWYFEATFPVVVVDWNGRIIGEGYATAQDEWMTEAYVPFSGEITFELPADMPYKRGTIIFQKANASGLPEHDDAFELPVIFE